MWNYVGIVRTTRRLERALHRIKLLKSEIDDYYANFRVNRDLSSCAPGRLRRADRALGADAPREPRPALQPRFPNTPAGQLPDRAGAPAPAAASKPKVYGLSG